MAKQSTYARLLKPGQKFYTKDDFKVYTVQRVDVIKNKDVTMVRVTVERRSNALVFDDTDRVELS